MSPIPPERLIWAVENKCGARMVESLWTTSEGAHRELVRLRFKYGRNDWMITVWKLDQSPEERPCTTTK